MPPDRLIRPSPVSRCSGFDQWVVLVTSHHLRRAGRHRLRVPVPSGSLAAYPEKLTLSQRRRHLVGQRPGDNHDITLTRRSTEHDAESVLVVSGSGHVPVRVRCALHSVRIVCRAKVPILITRHDQLPIARLQRMGPPSGIPDGAADESHHTVRWSDLQCGGSEKWTYIISTAQHARPKVMGHIEPCRAQLTTLSRVDRTYSVNRQL